MTVSDAAFSALTARVAALEAGALWRAPRLTAVMPKTGPATTGSVVFTRKSGVTAAVYYAIDGGPKAAAVSPISWGPLGLGKHRIDLFVGQSTAPELTGVWTITKA
jgi:hypothetical protein